MYHSESRDCKPVKKKKINTPFVHFGLFVCLFFLFFFTDPLLFFVILSSSNAYHGTFAVW